MRNLLVVAVIGLILGAASQAWANGGNQTPWVPGAFGGGGVPCDQTWPQFICDPPSGLCQPEPEYPRDCKQYCKMVDGVPHFKCKSPTVTGGW